FRRAVPALVTREAAIPRQPVLAFLALALTLALAQPRATPDADKLAVPCLAHAPDGRKVRLDDVAPPAAADKPLSPAEAVKQVGKKVTERASKDRLAKFGEIYLDSEADFRDKKNLAAVITKAGASKFAKAGVKNPAAHFKGKTILVTGTVTVKDEVARI